MLLDQRAGSVDVASAIPIYGVTAATLEAALATFGPTAEAYALACAFKGDIGQVLLAPAQSGALAGVLIGVEPDDAPHHDPFLAGKLATALPAGRYRLADGFRDPHLATLAFELASYRFERFRKIDKAQPMLVVGEDVDATRVMLIADAIRLGRDLINRPANDLTPAALEAAARELAATHAARCETVIGEDLSTGFPMIHAVGQAAAEAPRLVDLSWGEKDAPKVTLIGKGVCFDTGGLDIKPDAAMLLMKKDMGGAATALALAAMIMGAKLPVRLRVLIPIVENAIAGNAFRPGDVLTSRKGLTVEVGNTDAEGRLILADALTYAGEETPDLMLDFATLTGAARVALGPELPPFYTTSDELAAAIARHARAANDPCWRMPLWEPYDALLKGKIADLSNIAGGSFAGSVTAALFLRRFVDDAARWAHFDVYGWVPTARSGRPEGGEVQMAHALFDLIATRYLATAP